MKFHPRRSSVNYLIEASRDILRAWFRGNRGMRLTILFTFFLIVIAICLALIGELLPAKKEILNVIAGLCGIISGILAIIIISLQRIHEDNKFKIKIEQIEKRVQDNPKETQAAWELAIVKLESYINKNLEQVRSIFWLTFFVLIIGFLFIGFGVFLIYQNPENYKPSLISAVSGVIVNFIGATFLVLYKSTMIQAKDYVNILDRINAVGMSVKIINTLPDDEMKLKQQTTAELVKQILTLYTKNI